MHAILVKPLTIRILFRVVLHNLCTDSEMRRVKVRLMKKIEIVAFKFVDGEGLYCNSTLLNNMV